MLLLISSNAAQRYSDDIVRLLALPAGNQVQFRYDVKYLDPAVLPRAQSGQLSGERALVCFMMTDATTARAELASCRAVSIGHSSVVGSSCILTLTAGDYVHPLDDATIRGQLSPAELALVPVYSGTPAVIGGKFVIEVAAALDAGRVAEFGKDMKAFEETTAHLGRFPAFAPATGIAFFAVRSIVVPDPQKGWFRRIATSPARYVSGTYDLLSGVRYELVVYTYRPAGTAVGAVATKLIVDTDEKAVRFISNRQIVLDSRYDLHRFLFTTDDQLDALPARLTVALSVPDGATPPAFAQRCEVTLRVRFEARRREAVLRMLAIAFGTSWAALIGVAFKDKFGFWVGVAMCIGPFIAAYAATFPMLRKTS